MAEDKKVTIQGGCHCGFIRYKANVIIPDPPISKRCNCTLCHKSGWSSLELKSSDFTLLSPSSWDQVPDYVYRSDKIHKAFCNKCGIHVVGWGYYEWEGQRHDFFNLTMRSIDQPQDNIDLSKFTFEYYDGLHDNWNAAPKKEPW